MMQLANFRRHQRTRGQEDAVRQLEAQDEGAGVEDDCKKKKVAEDDSKKPLETVSGMSAGVPRLDTWCDVGAVVAACSSDESYHRADAHVGTVLAEGDRSRKMVPKGVACLAPPLHELDFFCITNAVESSIAIDGGQGYLCLFTRIFLPWGAIYETNLGMAEEERFTAGRSACLEAIAQIVKKACVVRRGRRPKSEARARTHQ